jgi:hypothetical protein
MKVIFSTNIYVYIVFNLLNYLNLIAIKTEEIAK